MAQIAAQQMAAQIFGMFAGSFFGSSAGPSVAAGGGSWLGDTSGFKLSGMRAKGGPVNPYGTYLVGENGPELLQMGGRSGVVIPNDKMLGGGGDSTVNVSIMINSDGTGRQESGGENEAMQLGRSIEASVMSVIMREKRPGGILV